MKRLALFPLAGVAAGGAGEVELLELEPAPGLPVAYVVRRSWSSHSLATPHSPYESIPTEELEPALVSALRLARLMPPGPPYLLRPPHEVGRVEVDELDESVRELESSAGVTFDSPAWRSFALGVAFAGGPRVLRELLDEPELLERLRRVIA